MFDFNRATTPAWWFNGKVLHRKHFGRVQLKSLNVATGVIRAVDGWLPWHGTSLIAVARKTDGPRADSAATQSSARSA